ncbi:taurine-pyruvate aminotransferase [Desulfonispora thiosulfatigenes DSM 11270]|uniref:Taurine-pyruvate aminotransferase n=1 Tax=Desulfonispora thiosulfatigenes DSM 11270 TaxID=656914 RepID=A0A1W1UW30_DESTI|nr:aminotransferase [Desulfonispora thiosulfatigenes]SMB85293.1 taurine-pyruvate aminotransferase [Desulfonispora thiosulfatigenes DSM 11270]
MAELTTEQLIAMDKDSLWHHLFQHKALETNNPLIVTGGKGLMIEDISGKQYLDAVSGAVWCVNIGYGRERMAKAVYDQLIEMPYYAGSAGNIPTIKLAGKLKELLPRLDKTFFANSGSEANEKAFKAVRQMNRLKGNNEKYKILYRDRDYHGTTIGALSATGQHERKADYGPFVPGFSSFEHACCYRCPFGKEYGSCEIECAQAVEWAIKREGGAEQVAAIIVEPITAGGGIIKPVPEYYPMVQKICKKYDVEMIMDEVVCGFGRTGKWFGHLHFDVDPDIMTTAKGMASAYQPLSCMMAKDHIFNVFKEDASDPLAFFRDISTYGGCAGSTAAGLENIAIMEEENLLDNTVKMGEYMLGQLNELRSMDLVGDVRGEGLFAGVELVVDKKTKQAVSEAQMAQVMADIAAQGVLCGRTNKSLPGLNNTVTLAPALVATKEDIDRIVGAIKNSLEKNAK